MQRLLIDAEPTVEPTIPPHDPTAAERCWGTDPATEQQCTQLATTKLGLCDYHLSRLTDARRERPATPDDLANQERGQS